MIGRTNIIFGSGSSSGGSGGVTTVDLPTCPSSLTASPANGKVTLALTYSDTDFVSGVEVRYKTGSYPTSPTDGSGLTAEGAATAVEISGLTNGATYYFRVYLYREIDGVKYYQTDETNAKVSAMPSSVHIEGMTPTSVGENYILLAESGTFTLHTSSDVTVYLVGGGVAGRDGGDTYYNSRYRGYGGDGGHVSEQLLSNISEDLVFTCVIASSVAVTAGSGVTKTHSTLTATGISLSSSSGAYISGGSQNTNGTNGVLTPYGYVGSSGGGGASTSITGKNLSGGEGGIGAGNGGYAQVTSGYNYAGDGTAATNYGCGGGGGGRAFYSGDEDGDACGKGGAGMQGCIILTWQS